MKEFDMAFNVEELGLWFVIEVKEVEVAVKDWSAERSVILCEMWVVKWKMFWIQLKENKWNELLSLQSLLKQKLK